MLSTDRRRRRRARLSRAPVRHRLVRRPARQARPQPDPLAGRLHASRSRVYCTSWTFYGAVGTAARRGVEFITIYTGPTIVFLGWWFLLRKIARISKIAAHHLDRRFHRLALRQERPARHDWSRSSRMVGTMPYIALQLKAVSTTFAVLVNYTLFADHRRRRCRTRRRSIFADAAFLTAIGMAIFAILFGTRHIDANEHHEGMVAAIAFESCVKLLAFLAVGLSTSSSPSARASASARRRQLGAGAATIWCCCRKATPARFLTMTLPVDGGDHLPAAPVPHHHRRERQRAPPGDRVVAVPALPAADEPVRAADRRRRPDAAAAGGQPRLLRADRADHAGAARRSRCSPSSAACRRRRRWWWSRRSRCRRWCATTSSCRCCCASAG